MADSVSVEVIATQLKCLVDNLHSAIDKGTFAENDAEAQLQLRCDAYADLIQQQDQMLTALRQRTEELEASSHSHDGPRKDLALQLRSEQRMRLRVEEQSATILSEQQRTIERLETKLRVAEGKAPQRSVVPRLDGLATMTMTGVLTTPEAVVAFLEDLNATESFDGRLKY